jgi:hypothetical protein
MEAPHRSEAECKLAGLMKTGTRHLPPDSVLLIIRVAREGAEDSLKTRLDEFSEYIPEADQDEVREQPVNILPEFEEAMLAWAQPEDGEDSDSGAG